MITFSTKNHNFISNQKKRKNKIEIIDLNKESFPLVIWVPAIQRGKSIPGITIFDTEKNMIYTKALHQ